jgi:predicted patatin/cPLA2 family phospholipase
MSESGLVGAKPTNTILVLEGGGLRGAFVAGALAELEGSPNLRFSHIFATSAAAASAAYLIAGQIDRALAIWRDRTHGAQLISPRHLLRGRGLMDIEGLVEVFQGELALDARELSRSATALYVAVTNCNTGAADHVAATQSNLFQLLKATMALPVVYGRVVQVEGVPYIDGGIADAIPIGAALALEPTRLIVVTTRPSGYRKKPAPFAGDLLRYNYRAFPALWPALRNRWESYNRSVMKLEAMERLGRVAVIRPTAPLPASRMTRDRGRIIETLELGRQAARAFLTGLEPHLPAASSLDLGLAGGSANGAAFAELSLQATGEEREHY